MNTPFSIIMSVYKNDVPKQLNVALGSLIHQTVLPSEIVIVGDGELPSGLCEEIDGFKKYIEAQKLPIDVVFLPLKENVGLGEAMRIASLEAKYDYLARMDADDICLPNRFEKQMKCFEEDLNLSVVGGMITEFDGEPDNIIAKRILPLDDVSIKKMMRGRCAINHVTAVFKKSDLIKSGNYQKNVMQEDHFLWARMMEHGCKFRNIPDIVVNVRSGKDQIARRGGWRFYKSVVRVFWYMYKHNLISFGYFIYICVVRGTVQLLMPNWLRTWIYMKFLRK